MTGASLATVPLLIVFHPFPAPDHQGHRADRYEGKQMAHAVFPHPTLQPPCPAAGLSLTPRHTCLSRCWRRTRRTPSCWPSAASSAPPTPRRLLRAMAAIRADGVAAYAYQPGIEDLFFRIEGRVIELAGADYGGNLQLARSRNDLGHALARMAFRSRLLEVIGALLALRRHRAGPGAPPPRNADARLHPYAAGAACHLRPLPRRCAHLAGPKIRRCWRRPTPT